MAILTFIKYFYGFYSIIIFYARYKNIYSTLSKNTQLIQHLAHFEPTPDMEWLIQGDFGKVLVGKFSNISILN